jgi:hypothetical protein
MDCESADSLGKQIGPFLGGAGSQLGCEEADPFEPERFIDTGDPARREGSRPFEPERILDAGNPVRREAAERLESERSIEAATEPDRERANPAAGWASEHPCGVL